MRGERSPRAGLQRVRAAIEQKFEQLKRDEQGAVTAEYAIIITAGVAFAGLIVVVIRSPEVRNLLAMLVQNALGTTV